MKEIIIYGSQYGTTKSYAERFSIMTEIQLVSSEKTKDLSNYDTVIHFGGLYAGGVKGLKNTVKLLPENASLLIVTVGISDVENKENTDNIKNSISRQVSEELMKRTTIFHLRGGIDYQKLNFIHKTMMKLLYNKAKKLPEEKLTPEMKEMIETYNTKVDFTDYDSLKPIMERLHK